MAAISTDPLIIEARARWARCDEAESNQRSRILKAKQFRAGDQWEEAIKIQRQGSSAIQGQAAQPPRPCLTIDRLSAPCRQVSNGIKSAQFGFDVMPNGQGADTETAEILKGYLRRVHNDARAESPIEWAADQAIEGGLGWFRIRADYVQQAPAAFDLSVFDQELKLERITNNLTVYCDPSASKPTRSDALFMFVTEDLSRDEFRRRWPKADDASLDGFMSTGDRMKSWVTDHEIRIAEYWTVTYIDETWALLTDGSVVTGKIPKDGVQATRVVRKPIVKGYKINACEVLESWDWLGSRIPIVPIIGEEINVDGTILLRGIIEEGMDAQRMVNYTYSGAMEIFALGPKAPYVVAAGQVEQYKAIWQTANTYNWAYLPYDPQSLEGSPIPPPQRNQSEPPIQAAVELMAKSEECIKATTGIFDPGLGNASPRERSGRAIDSLKSSSDLTSSNYPANVARALVYAGELMMEIAPKITRPGQLMHILGKDDEPDQVVIGQHFVPGQNGVPEVVNPDDARVQQGVAKFYDLSRGQYSVTVVAGKATSTRREEGAHALGDLIPHLPPEMAAVATPDYVEQLSFPGSHQIAEKLKKALPPALQEQDDDQPVPPQVKAQMQAMGAKMQEMQQAIETDQAKQQATIVKAQADGQTKLQLAQIDRQTKIDIAMINANAGIAEADIKAQNDDLDRRLKMVELFLTASKEAQMQAFDHAHEREMSHVERQHETEMADQGHQHGDLDRRQQDRRVIGVGEEFYVVGDRQCLDHQLLGRDELVQAVAEQDGERCEQADGDKDRRRRQERRRCPAVAPSPGGDGGAMGDRRVGHPLNDLSHHSLKAESFLAM